MTVVGVLATLGCGSAPPQQVAEPASNGHVHRSPPPPAPLRAGERFIELGLARPYQPVPPAGTDEYRCFLLDPKLTEAAYITGEQLLPQNLELVHHAILFKIAPANVEHARAVDAANERDGWPCWGGTGLVGSFTASAPGPGETYIGSWAPGRPELLMGGVAGYLAEPGTQIVLQVHYNLLSTEGRPGPQDQSALRLRVMPGTASVHPLVALRLPAPIELPCTPQESGPLCDRAKAIDDLVLRTEPDARKMVEALNACNKGTPPPAGNTQHCDHAITTPALIHAVAPHMHLLGRAISVELNPGTPGARMLLNQPQFNFDDQAHILLPEPVRINPGDTVRVTCTHDASLRSKLPELKTLQPRYVVWGDGTSDEMCLATLFTTTDV